MGGVRHDWHAVHCRQCGSAARPGREAGALACLELPAQCPAHAVADASPCCQDWQWVPMLDMVPLRKTKVPPPHGHVLPESRAVMLISLAWCHMPEHC